MNISSVVPSIDTATETMTDFEKVDPVRRRRSADTCLFRLPSGTYKRSFGIGIFHIGNFCFWVPFLKQLLLGNCAEDFVEICNVYVGKMIIKAAKRILNSDKICRSYSDLNFGITFFGTQCITKAQEDWWVESCPADHLERSATKKHINKAVANFIKCLTAYMVVATNSAYFEHLHFCSNSVHLQVCILLSSPTNRLFSEPPTDYWWKLCSEC